ncbi:group-specific protein [Salicibibacter cibarius]|uniref:Group-specific protein n=1 Tax=Salicibibacter cibarius TaxID=2743000 RepID=A0A7T6Z0X1_9BACI|nr:group-specific protein [Salicibibacter cibarius]QQK74753.1 group-specific protein [Salicibibacter cibarius]
MASSCPIDHTPEQVKEKLDNQHPYLPENIYVKAAHLLNQEQSQETLNELFHLLKKYDLAETRERKERNEKILALA